MSVAIDPSEVGPLKIAMRDLQISASRYYAATASNDELGALVRAFITNGQTINDWLTNVIADATTYKQHFNAPRHPKADYIDAFRYVRNVSQHVMHIVEPANGGTLVGGVLGMRFYAEWDAIPSHVHARLHPHTQALKPLYDSKLQGHEVMETMMEVLRFYGDVAPDIVHRDPHGEWTGFPLMSQPGMPSPLHPEEPPTAAEGRAWMDNRRPGGDLRVITGQVIRNGESYVYGQTFVGRLSFAPFSETIAQANKDISGGYPYVRGIVQGNVDVVTDEFPDMHQGDVLRSREPIESWTVPVDEVESAEDWASPGYEDQGPGFVRIENSGYDFAEPLEYNVRRARRLNAVVPPSASF